MALAPTATGETTPALAASCPVTSDSDPLPTLQLPLDLRLSPEQFALVCATNPHAVLEPADATPVRQGPCARRWRNGSAAGPASKEELHPHFNTILINGVGGIWRLAVIAGQIEIAPGEIQLGGIADGVAHANLGIA